LAKYSALVMGTATDAKIFSNLIALNSEHTRERVSYEKTKFCVDIAIITWYIWLYNNITKL